ncbi:MAG: pentapeptide repeat-containing protein [Hyphomicrobium sp.]|nr:pentapeptide repeat-containing protein [Hyphomicrobium sp.]
MPRIATLCLLTALAASPAAATEPFTFTLVSPEADFTAREVTAILYRAEVGGTPDFTGRDLTYLDLSALDFKGAKLTRADLYGTDFTNANLKGADLEAARLDRAVLIKTDLSGANLAGASIYRPTVYSDLNALLTDAPRFRGANMARVKVQADLSGADFAGADLTDADFHPLEDRPGEGTLVTLRRNVVKSCDFSGVRAERANFSEAVLTFSRMTGASLKGANFRDADLSMVDFSGADLSGADLTGADLDGAKLAGARGLDTVIGLDKTVNLDKAFR